ncbi:MAG: FG-GAP-like repeat-containing protein [Candidatus Edwardsbacteria bacterium]|nr:FG-GAP-like repeat-containing protein [Candidatus Edwardsbacteria bacterium]
MKKIAVIIIMACLFVAGQSVWAGTWREASQADFADGDFNANVFTSTDGSDSGCLKSNPGAIYDLNKDGRPDLVISNMHDNSTNFNINSYVYWGKHDWTFSADSCLQLPTHGATGNSVADLNKDGNLDIVFSSYNDNSSWSTNSLIYWGSKDGFHLNDTMDLPTLGAHANCVVDLNHDGELDIIFANYRGDDYSNNVNSYIYWGSKDGYNVGNRTDLPTIGATDIAVADLNKDGRLDIVFTNRQGDYGGSFTFNLPSYIYYGQGTSNITYDTSHRDQLETHGAYGVSVDDLDNDGWLDIVFSNCHDGASYNIKSYIYWGSSTGFTTRPRTELPTKSAYCNAVADIDHDGHKDIIFANWYDRDSLPYTVDTHDVPSYVYWGPDFISKTDLPSHGAVGVIVDKMSQNGTKDVLITNGVQGPGFYGTTFNTWSYIYHNVGKTGYTGCDSIPSVYGHISTKDNGNAHNRSKSETYGSSVFGNGTDIYEWGICSWVAAVPESTSVEVSMRTGSTAVPDDINWCGWLPITKSGSKASVPSAKYAQYQLTYNSNNFFEAPVIDEVSLDYQVSSGISGDKITANDFEVKIISSGNGIRLSYSLPKESPVDIAVYNIEGRLVRIIFNGEQRPGQYNLSWNGLNANNAKISSGVYLCRAKFGSKIYNNKIVFVK